MVRPPQRFRVSETGCWNWFGSLDKDGYGKVERKGKGQKAHRAFYDFFVGKIPSGFQIDHLCRNTSCVNPKHLEAVTPAENTQRSRTAKLNKKKVLAIRKMLINGIGGPTIAKLFGVKNTIIYEIKSGKKWKSLLEA